METTSYESLEAKLQRAIDELYKGNYDTTELLAHEILDALDTQPLGQNDNILRGESILALAKINTQRGKYELGLEQSHQVLALAEQYMLDDVLLKALNLLGSIYRILGNYSQSLEYYNRALNSQEKKGATSDLANIWGSIGIVHLNLGSYAQVLDYLSKALAVHEQLGEKFSIAKVTGNIGVVYQNLGSYEKALEYYGKTIITYEEIGQKPGIANVLGNIGTLYFSLDNFNLALEYTDKALTKFEELGEKSHVARITGNLGTIYFKLGNYNKALEYLFKAQATLEELSKKDGIAIFTECIGTIYADQSFEGYNPELAEEYFLRAINLSEDLGAKHNLSSFHLSLSALYKSQERWKEAYLQFVKYNEHKETVITEEATKQAQLMEHKRKIEESERDRQIKLARFHEQEKILHNILPYQIANRMIDGEKTIADSHANVSVFFSDIVGFTKISQSVSAEELVGMLNGIFSQFDQIARKHGLEKIKTIGDAYMAVCGAPIHVEDHAERTTSFALEVVRFMNDYQTNTGNKIMVRIGLHTGSVVAGIIGENRFAYDMWGDAVNTASRMESHGEAGKIHISEDFMKAVEPKKHLQVSFIPRGEMDIKGKGMMKTYFLEKTKQIKSGHAVKPPRPSDTPPREGNFAQDEIYES